MAKCCRLRKSLKIQNPILQVLAFIFDKNVAEIAKNVEPSARGELEIVDVIKGYLKKIN